MGGLKEAARQGRLIDDRPMISWLPGWLRWTQGHGAEATAARQGGGRPSGNPSVGQSASRASPVSPVRPPSRRSLGPSDCTMPPAKLVSSSVREDADFGSQESENGSEEVLRDGSHPSSMCTDGVDSGTGRFRMKTFSHRL